MGIPCYSDVLFYQQRYLPMNAILRRRKIDCREFPRSGQVGIYMNLFQNYTAIDGELLYIKFKRCGLLRRYLLSYSSF
jgi:hypothetical protein